jgi:AbrB family looped-hinge helix DNA binding protein
MNARAKISSKGQLVLPKAIRDAYGLGAGSEVDIETAGDAIVLKPRKRRPQGGRAYTVDDVAGMLKYDGPPVAIEDMNRLVEEDFRRRWNAKGN